MEEYKNIPLTNQSPNEGYPLPGYNNDQVFPVMAPIFGGISYQYIQDPMDELESSRKVLIRQKPQFIEQMFGCESANRYYVFSESPQQGVKLLFKCKEFSSCWMRNCCPANNRAFKMDIKHIANAYNFNDDFSIPFLKINRPYKCACCCCCRPEMFINLGSNNQFLGRIVQPFQCCDPKFLLYNNDGLLRYMIHADCCQCGLCCANSCCGKLSKAVFNIYKGADINTISGTIIKRPAKSGEELFTNADSYEIQFPINDITVEDKILLIVAGLMIDYQYFEQSPVDKNHPTIQLGGYRNY